MEDADKVIYYESLNVLITDIAEESNRSPIDEKKLGELLRTLYSEIQLMPADEVRASALLLEVYFSGQNVLCGMQANIEDSNKVDFKKFMDIDRIHRLAALLGEIELEITHSPIDRVKLESLHIELGEEILRFADVNDRFYELLKEVFYSVLSILADLSVKYIGSDKDSKEYSKCMQTCIDENKFPLWKWLTKHDVFNPPANKLVGKTPRAGFGIPRHPTSWQHWLGTYKSGRFKHRLDPLGKAVGRFSIDLTIFEGFYDIGTMGNCAIECLPDGTFTEPCKNKSCILFPYRDRLMFE